VFKQTHNAMTTRIDGYTDFTSISCH